MKIEGKCHRFGDNISTDDIIAGKYKNRILNMDELKIHLMENLDSKFFTRFHPGDIVVAGENFGIGSSREAAARVIQAAGCQAVIAKSFARIFFRNSFNIGLMLLECDTDSIKHGDRLSIDTQKDEIRNLSHRETLRLKPLPSFMRKVLSDGGLIIHFQKYGGFKF